MFIRFMILLLVVALAAPFFIPGPDGRPVMTLEKLGIGNTPDLASLPQMPGSGSDSASRTLYRFQDEQGNWHFSDQAPSSGEFELVEVGQTNLLDSSSLPAPAGNSPPPVALPGLPLPGNTARALDEATAVQEQLDQRAQNMDKAINALQ